METEKILNRKIPDSINVQFGLNQRSKLKKKNNSSKI